jgi:hypothetical protein
VVSVRVPNYDYLKGRRVLTKEISDSRDDAEREIRVVLMKQEHFLQQGPNLVQGKIGRRFARIINIFRRHMEITIVKLGLFPKKRPSRISVITNISTSALIMTSISPSLLKEASDGGFSCMLSFVSSVLDEGSPLFCSTPAIITSLGEWHGATGSSLPPRVQVQVCFVARQLKVGCSASIRCGLGRWLAGRQAQARSPSWMPSSTN